MNITIQPGKLKGLVTAPPSKSYGHRMLLCAQLAEGDSVISGLSESEDILATKDCLHALQERTPDAVFPCRESGSTLRFLIPSALVLCGGGIFTGTQRLIERGIGIYEEIFASAAAMGADICLEKEADKIRIKGNLPAGNYKMRGDVSSQFVTGMLLALPLLEGNSMLRVLPPVESRPYIDITIDVMKQFGVAIREVEPNLFLIRGGQKYQAGNYQVEGDWSNGAFLYGFREIGSDLQIQGLNMKSLQGDKACLSFFKMLPDQTIDLSDTPDLGPVLFAVAAAKGGGAFTGIRRLRIKESDRAQAMADELAKFGVVCRVTENEMILTSSGLKKPEVPLDGHNDHRIVMALSILASITGGTILGAQAVRKSWPDYFTVMQKAGMELSVSES